MQKGAWAWEVVGREGVWRRGARGREGQWGIRAVHAHLN